MANRYLDRYGQSDGPGTAEACSCGRNQGRNGRVVGTLKDHGGCTYAQYAWTFQRDKNAEICQ